MKTHLKNFTKLFIMLLAIAVAFTACNEDEEPLSSESEISSFVFSGLTPPVTADVTGTTITATVPYGTDVTSLAPTIAVPEEATVEPASGTAQDFSSPVTYTVTAEDGTTTTYTVTVTVEEPTLTITPVWEMTILNNGIPSWFTSNNDRDIALGSNYIYAHNNADKIRVLDKTDGSLVSAGATDFIDAKENFESGTFRLANVATDVNGVIVGSILRTDVNPFYVYKWDNKDATQELLINYSNPEGWRIGDNIDVVGDVTADAFVYTVAAGADVNKVLRWEISSGQVVDPNPTIIDLQITGTGNSPDIWALENSATSDFYIGGTGVSIARFSSDGSLEAELPPALNDGENMILFGFAMDVAYFELEGREFVVAVASDAANDSKIAFIDVTDGLENVTADDVTYYDYVDDANVVSNANATGGIDVMIDGTTAHVATLITNHGVAYLDVTLE